MAKSNLGLNFPHFEFSNLHLDIVSQKIKHKREFVKYALRTVNDVTDKKNSWKEPKGFSKAVKTSLNVFISVTSLTVHSAHLSNFLLCFIFGETIFRCRFENSQWGEVKPRFDFAKISKSFCKQNYVLRIIHSKTTEFTQKLTEIGKNFQYAMYV